MPLAVGAAVVVPIVCWSYASSRGVFAFWGKKVIAISEAVDGEQVTIRGKVVLLESLEAPFSKDTCAAYHLSVKRRQGVGKSAVWVPVLTDTKSQAFIVVDESGGRACIDGTSLRLYLKPHKQGTSGVRRNEEVDAFLSTRVAAKKARVHVCESVVLEGQHVTVHGVGKWEPDPDAAMETSGYRGAERPKRLRIVGDDAGAVIVR